MTTFERLGFHKATMPDIAREAGMSAANMYRYFASKEALVAALVDEERREASAEIERVAASPNPVSALIDAVGAHVKSINPAETALTLEILAESLRSPSLGDMVRRADIELRDKLAAALQLADANGRLRSGIDCFATATIVLAILDGLLWRRAIDSDFDGEAMATTLRTLLEAYFAPP